MKWKTRKLATVHTNSGFLEERTLPQKRNFFKKVGANIGQIIIIGLKKKNTYVVLICSSLIILFIYTGLNKMMDYNEFKIQLSRSPFIDRMSNFIAVTLPVGELLISLALVVKQTRLLGLYLSFALMLIFTGYIWLMLNYASDLPCSCGGILAKMSWKDHLYFNAIFTVLGMTGIVLQSKSNHDRTK